MLLTRTQTMEWEKKRLCIEKGNHSRRPKLLRRKHGRSKLDGAFREH